MYNVSHFNVYYVISLSLSLSLSLSSPDQQHQIEQFLLDIMSSVIQDAEQLSQQLVDTLLGPLIEPNKVRGRERVKDYL